MQKVAQKLQSVKKFAKVKKVKIKMLKRQLQEVEIKSDMLKKKLGLFKAKKQK